MAATLRLTRKSAGIELWRGRFDVTVDGIGVGTLERQDTIETPVTPGPHTLVLRMGRYSCQPRTFTAADGELIAFRCHGAEGWPSSWPPSSPLTWPSSSAPMTTEDLPAGH